MRSRLTTIKTWGALAVGLIVLAGLFAASCGGAGAETGTTSAGAESNGALVVSAAADLSPVLDEIIPVFEAESGIDVKVNIGSTGQLTDQIAAGAPVDVFLAASRAAIDQLEQKGLLVPGSAQPYARGLLALWTREGSGISVKSLEDLASSTVKRISIANPDHAPYGRAAREALQAVGLWETLQDKLVPAENVRQAFQFAETGNVDVGLVAISLVTFADGSYELVPEDLHEPIDQVLAIIDSSTRREEAERFVTFITGDKGREVLERFGFILPGQG